MEIRRSSIRRPSVIMKSLRCICFITIILLGFIVIIASGGGGGDGGGSSNNSSNNNDSEDPQNLEQAVITRENAGFFMDAAFQMVSLSTSMIYDVPYIVNTFYNNEGEGSFNREAECDNSNGRTSVSGNLSLTSGTGEIIFTDQQCEYSQSEIETDGVMRVNVNKVDAGFYPTEYKVTFESYKTSSTSGNYGTIIEGTLSVVSAEGDKQIAILDIRITDIISGSYIETDELTFNYDVPVGAFPYPEDITISGTVGCSEFGTVQLNSGTSIMDYIEIAGEYDTSILIAFLDENNFIASLDEDGDELPDSYLHTSVYELRGSFLYSNNRDPIVEIDEEIEVMQEASVSLSLLNITDLECDFLDFSVDLIESPSASRFEWLIDDYLNMVIEADKPGDYIFNLTVNDGSGGIITREIRIHVMLDAPQVSLEQTLFQCTSGEFIEINLSASNPDQGPFSYSLSPELPGMTISDEGVLEWQTAGFQNIIFWPTEADITVKAIISNADHEIEIPLTFSIIYPDKKQPIVRTGIEVPGKERNIHTGDFDNDDKTEILLTDNNNLIYTLEWSEGKYIQDWVYPYEINSSGNSIDSVLPFDGDNDGYYEIFVQTGPEIKIIKMIDNTVADSIDLSQFLNTGVIRNGRGMAAADLDDNGYMELVALFGTDYDASGIAFVMDASSLNLLWQIPALGLGMGMGLGNVDADSAIEIVFAGGYVYDGTTHASQWVYSEEFGNDIIVGDIDGNGVDEIVGNRAWNPPAVYDAVLKSALFEFAEEEDICSIAAGNLDDDPQMEIIIGDCQWGDVSAYDADSGSAIEIWSVDSQDHGTESLAVGDPDQDGNPEVIWGTGLSSSGEDSIVVFDSQDLTVDFQNTNPSQLGSPYIGGRSITNSSGESRIVFAVAETESGYRGSRLLSMDFSAGDIEISPIIQPSPGINATGFFDFCVADYDLDETEEVLLSSSDFYDGFLSIYDLFNSEEEWLATGDHYTAGDISCGDANGDGHADLVTIWDSAVRLYDPFNQVLLWNGVKWTSKPTQVELQDLDADDIPEILALSTGKMVVYSKSGSNYFEEMTYTGSKMNNFVIYDIDGDLEQEVIISDIQEFSSYGSSEIILLDNNFDIEKSFSIEGKITAIAASGEIDNTLLVATSDQDYHSEGARCYVKLVSMDSGDVIWSSPPLLGAITRESLHIVQKEGSSTKQLAIGTCDAMYITQ